jgi:putative peptidoglycan lipid II flippase
MALGVAVMSLMTPIDLAFAATVGDGAIASLGYTNRLISLVVAVCATALTRSLLPVLAAVRSANLSELGRTQTIKWAGAAFLLGGALSLILWAAAPWLVTVLLQRGSFTGQHTAEVTSAFQAGVVQLPFYFCGIVLVQWLSVLGRYGTMLSAAVAAIAAKLAFGVALIDTWGTSGILYSTAAAYAASLAISLRSVLRNPG